MEGPKRIYLTKDEESFSEVLWCEDRINDDDIEYIRADLVKELVDKLRRAMHTYHSVYPNSENYKAMYNALDELNALANNIENQRTKRG